MRHINNLNEKLKNGNVVMGLCSMYPCPGMVEAMSKGWDFVWVDIQHGQYTYESALHSLQAARAAGVDTMVRVPVNEYSVIGRYADLQTSAIMVPMVNNAKQAGEIVKALNFPPFGDRSYGGRRVIDLFGREYYFTWETLAVAQIETLEAVENVEEIINTKGIDMVFFGPDDMKLRSKVHVNTGAWEDEKLSKAIVRVAEAAENEGKFAGIVTTRKEDFVKAVDCGYRMIVCGADSGIISAGSSSILKEFRSVYK